MARKKKTELSREGKTELAKSIAEKGQKFTRTYANVENTVAKFFRWISTWVDKILFNQKHGKAVALVLAVLLYMVVNAGDDSSNIFATNKSTTTIDNIPVSTVVSNEVYEVSGLPESVSAVVVGELSDIQLLNSQKNFQVVADLSEFTEGTHEVTLKPVNFSPRVKVTLNPSTAMVTIKRKTSKVFTLGYDFVNTDKMDKIYSLGKPEFEQGEVIVHASQDTVDKIAFVKALIDVSGVTKTFETEAEIVAYDQNGNRIDVDILPGKMKAKVEVTTPTKDVPITVVPVGKVPNGKAIESYTLDHDSVTLYGPKEVLDEITELQIQLPASTLNGDKTVPMPIILPTGVTKASIQRVNIEVKLADKEETTIKNIPIAFKNNKKGFQIATENKEDAYADVLVSGAKKVLDKLKAEDISVYFDLSKVTQPGTQEVPLLVSGKNKLVSYSLSKSSIKIKLVLPD